MISRISLCYSILCIQVFTSADSEPLVAYAGNNVTLRCHHDSLFTRILAADWVYCESGSTTEMEVCLDGFCINGFSKRFSVDRKENFNLSIQSVVATDSGNYTCISFDEFEMHRHTTELNVPDHSKPTTDGFDTATTSPNGDVWFVPSLIIGIIVGSVFSSLIILVACHSVKCRNRDSTTSEIVSMQPSTQTTIGFHTNRESSTSFTTTHTDWDKKELFSSQLKTVEDVMLINDSRLLALSFLKLFREFYNGSNASASAAETFQLLASLSTLWWKTLRKIAVKRRISCLIYYERSGYSVCPTRLDSVQPYLAITPVMAVTVMNGRVYTICKESDTIHADSDQKGYLRIKGMKFPVDIVACTAAEVLYVADERRCIWCVHVGGEKMKWQAFRERIPKTLSINCHGSLLVTTDSNVILKFTGDGSEETVINLEEHTEVLHAVETSYHTVIVCYTRSTRASFVAEIKFEGQKIRQFICVPQLIRTPSYLALDRDGRILVADPGNSRILLLDSKLKHSYTIIDHRRHGIGTPHRLCLDELTGKLLVADWPNHSVQAFNVKTSTSTLFRLH